MNNQRGLQFPLRGHVSTWFKDGNASNIEARLTTDLTVLQSNGRTEADAICHLADQLQLVIEQLRAMADKSRRGK